jgi:hypothetical protein
LSTTAPANASLPHAGEVLREQMRRIARLDGEVLLHLNALAAADGGIGQHDVV